MYEYDRVEKLLDEIEKVRRLTEMADIARVESGLAATLERTGPLDLTISNAQAEMERAAQAGLGVAADDLRALNGVSGLDLDAQADVERAAQAGLGAAVDDLYALSGVSGLDLDAQAEMERAAQAGLGVAADDLRALNGVSGLDLDAQAEMERAAQAGLGVAVDNLRALSGISGIGLSVQAQVLGKIERSNLATLGVGDALYGTRGHLGKQALAEQLDFLGYEPSELRALEFEAHQAFSENLNSNVASALQREDAATLLARYSAATRILPNITHQLTRLGNLSDLQESIALASDFCRESSLFASPELQVLSERLDLVLGRIDIQANEDIMARCLGVVADNLANWTPAKGYHDPVDPDFEVLDLSVSNEDDRDFLEQFVNWIESLVESGKGLRPHLLPLLFLTLALISLSYRHVPRLIEMEVKIRAGLAQELRSKKRGQLTGTWTVVSKEALPVRERGERRSKLKGLLYPGVQVKILTKGKKWSEVEWSHGGRFLKGWVFSRYLEKQEVETEQSGSDFREFLALLRGFSSVLLSVTADGLYIVVDISGDVFAVVSVATLFFCYQRQRSKGLARKDALTGCLDGYLANQEIRPSQASMEAK